MRRSDVVVSGARLAVWEEGEGTPLLALHGFSANHGFVIETVEAAARQRDGWRRIYLDLPGMGESSAGKIDPTSDSLVEILGEVVSELIGSERFALVGQSYGGYLALGLLASMPERVAGLALVVPLVEARRDRRVVPEIHKLVVDDNALSGLAQEVFEELWPLTVRESRDLAQRLSRLEWKFDEAFVEALQAPDAYSFSSTEIPEQYPAPTLLVCGRQDDVVGHQQANELISGFSRATAVTLDGGGHLLEFELPALVTMLILDWLDRVKETLA